MAVTVTVEEWEGLLLRWPWHTQPKGQLYTCLRQQALVRSLNQRESACGLTGFLTTDGGATLGIGWTLMSMCGH